MYLIWGKWILKEDILPIPIKAAILSYQFLTIHPFNDGNGRTARGLATYLLSIYGYDMKGFYSMEKFYAMDLDGYYKSIQMNLPVLYYDGRNNPANLAPWIEYFVRIMALAFEKAAKEKAQQAEIEKQEALANILITSGFNFDGYNITKYSGYISGDDAVEVDRDIAFFVGSTGVADRLLESLTVIRRNALKELKEAVFDLGCNAFIAVDFDYLTLEPETINITGDTLYLPYVFCVTANGNAIIIEKSRIKVFVG